MESTSNWVELLALICLAVTAFFILLQAREANALRRLEAMLRVHEKISTTEARKDRARLYDLHKEHKDNLAAHLEKNDADSDKATVERICVDNDVIGMLIKEKLVPKDDFFVRTF